MTTDAFCTLSPDELTQRLDWIRREIAPHAQRRVALEGGIAWEFDASSDTRSRLERLAQLEGACCGPSGLEFAVRAPREDTLRFEIVGPNAAGVAHAFESGDVAIASPTSTGKSGRFARIAGVATLGALFVCCVLPIGVAAVAGAAIAAPLLRLDHPAAIVGVGLVFGFATWRFERRRTAQRLATAPAADTGCGY